MADKIVTSLPGDALREGVTLSIASIEDADQRTATVEAIKAAIADLGFEGEAAKGAAIQSGPMVARRSLSVRWMVRLI